MAAMAVARPVAPDLYLSRTVQLARSGIVHSAHPRTTAELKPVAQAGGTHVCPSSSSLASVHSRRDSAAPSVAPPLPHPAVLAARTSSAECPAALLEPGEVVAPEGSSRRMLAHSWAFLVRSIRRSVLCYRSIARTVLETDYLAILRPGIAIVITVPHGKHETFRNTSTIPYHAHLPRPFT